MSTTKIMDTSLRVKRRHKVWPEALNREIVAACLATGASVSTVARQYDVNTNMVFAWLKLYCGVPDIFASKLVPVVVTPAPPIAATPAPSSDLPPVDIIEIELPRGYRVRIGGNIKASTLRVVLQINSQPGLNRFGLRHNRPLPP